MKVAPVQPRLAPRLDRVVVGIDASEAAGAVLRAAAQLPLSAAASILVVHVVQWGMGHSAVAYALLEQKAQQRLAEAAVVLDRLLTPTMPRPTIATALLFGEPFVELVRRARDDHADVVVVGRHGEKSFLDSLVGATAERIVRKGTTGVLVVGGQARPPYERPLLALDLSEASARALELALRVVAPGTTFDVVHARAKDDDELAAVAAVNAFLRRYEIDASLWTVVVREGDPRRVLLEEVRGRRSDLIVLGTHGRSALAQVLLGSVAEAVVRRATCDVLVGRPTAHSFVLP